MKNRQILFTSPGVAEVVSCEMPIIEPDEVLIETDYTVISAGTERDNLVDTANVSHEWPKRLGYSGSGHIVEVGSNVTEYKVGDRVLMDHLWHVAYAKSRFNKNGNGFFKITEDIDQIDAAFVVVGSMGVQGARKTKLQMGETAMVRGVGILGLFAIQSMRNMGAMPLIAVCSGEERQKIAIKLGADYAISPDDDFYNNIRELTDGRMINAAVEVTGSSLAMTQCLKVAAREGRIALTGCTRVSDVPIDFYSMVHKPGIQLIGAHNFIRPEADSYPGYWTRHDDFATIIRMIKMGRMQVKPIISNVLSTDDAPKIYKELARNGRIGLGTVFDWHK